MKNERKKKQFKSLAKLPRKPKGFADSQLEMHTKKTKNVEVNEMQNIKSNATNQLTKRAGKNENLLGVGKT